MGAVAFIEESNCCAQADASTQGRGCLIPHDPCSCCSLLLQGAASVCSSMLRRLSSTAKKGLDQCTLKEMPC